jgi:hypothetical protein
LKQRLLEKILPILIKTKNWKTNDNCRISF